jgi:3-hydroxyisobutyrate dehydrogenase-like beta-hydroxyacid dehydrogenase
VATSVAELCQERDVVVSMLVEDATILSVATGPEGLVDSLTPGAVHLVMGTHGVATIRALEARHAEAGQVLVAAPVLGRPDLAAAGQLGIVVAGPIDAATRVRPLLDVMGRRIFEAGPKPESATAIKLANNAVLGCAMMAMAEGFSLVRRYDVDPQVFQDVMTEGLFSAPAYKVYGQKMVDESYDQVGSPITVGLKDAGLIAAAAALARVPMPSHNVYLDRLLGAVAHGDADRDQAVLAREQNRASGIE